MPVARVCSFCGSDIEPGTGSMFVRRDGTVFFFDRSKCEKNLLKLGRVPRTVPWTRAALQAKARATGMALEEERPAVAVVEEAGAEVEEDFALQLPKGKDIPQAVHDLIDRRLGPGLSASTIEHRFREFSGSDGLRESLATWYVKRHPKKRVTEVELDEYVAYLDTSAGKKALKDWLEDEAKKEKAAKEA